MCSGTRPRTPRLLSGRLDPERLTALLDTFGGDAVDSWFLCGPLPLTDMVTDTLRGARGAGRRRSTANCSTPTRFRRAG